MVSHPIPYFCSQYESWASLPGVDLRVFFASTHGLKEYFDEQFSERVQWDGLVLNFPHSFADGADGRAITNEMDAADLDAHLDSFAPNIVLIYGYRQPLLRRAMRWARRNRAQLFMLTDMEVRSKSSLVRRFAKKIVLPRLLKQVRVFLTVGDANEDSYRHYGIYDERFVRCGFPIDRGLFNGKRRTDEGEPQRARKALHLPLEQKIVLNVGKLVPWKRTQDLVDFSNRMQGRRDDITVLLVGTGPDESALRMQCRREGVGGVIFAGFVQPHRLADYYLAADVYIACSDRDRHPLTVSEAIYAGLPVVISDRCGSYGPTDDVQPGVNGFVYRCGNVVEMTRLLLHIVDTPELLASMSRESVSIGKKHQTLAHGEGLQRAMNVINADHATTGAIRSMA